MRAGEQRGISADASRRQRAAWLGSPCTPGSREPTLQPHRNASRGLSQPGGVWYAPRVTPEPATTAIRPADADPRIRPMFDAPSIDSPSYRQFLEALGVAVYTTDAEGRITFFNEAAADFWGRRPEIGEEWCGSWKLFWPDGRPMRHDECPMAIALKEARSVRGIEGVAERPDGTRAAFVPYPTVVFDGDGRLIGAINVLVDVTERRRAEDALRAANAVKDEFLGLVSHELRTPVTTIFGNARLLQGTGELPERTRRDGRRYRDRRGASARARREPAPHDARCQRAAADRSRAAGPGSCRPPDRRRLPAPPPGARDPTRHRGRRARSSTAIRATSSCWSGTCSAMPTNTVRSSEPIEVVLQRVGDEAHVTVRDRGIGIPDETDRLFTAFYRTDAARRMSGGLGIGLSASRHVVAILGGQDLGATPRRWRLGVRVRPSVQRRAPRLDGSGQAGRHHCHR